MDKINVKCNIIDLANFDFTSINNVDQKSTNNRKSEITSGFKSHNSVTNKNIKDKNFFVFGKNSKQTNLKSKLSNPTHLKSNYNSNMNINYDLSPGKKLFNKKYEEMKLDRDEKSFEHGENHQSDKAKKILNQNIKFSTKFFSPDKIFPIQNKENSKPKEKLENEKFRPSSSHPNYISTKNSKKLVKTNLNYDFDLNERKTTEIYGEK